MTWSLDFTEVQSAKIWNSKVCYRNKEYAVFIFFDWTSRNCLYIHLYPQHIAATYGYSQTCHIYPPSGCGISMQLMPHLVGQLLLLFVRVCQSWWHSLWAVILTWEQTQLICVEMWITSTLRFQKFDGSLACCIRSMHWEGGLGVCPVAKYFSVLWG